MTKLNLDQLSVESFQPTDAAQDAARGAEFFASQPAHVRGHQLRQVVLRFLTLRVLMRD